MQVELLRITEDPLSLIEDAIRICHDSQEQGEESRDNLIKRIIKMGHESVLEHASASFHIRGISRACSHQLVRYRIASYSQKSQRFVKENDFEYITPESVKEPAVGTPNSYPELMEKIKEKYTHMIACGVPAEDARMVLPNACTTELVMTMNFRELRHFLEQRLSKKAQWEIRELAQKILELLTDRVSIIFDDFKEAVCQTNV